MKSLVVANQKGGVGKTAILVHLAYFFAEKGLKVAVVDLDTQGNASFTLDSYSMDAKSSSLLDGTFQSELHASQNLILFGSDSKLVSIENDNISTVIKNFSNSLDKIREAGFDVCLIDTAPSFGNKLTTAIACADYVISPIELEIYSILGIRQMVVTIKNIKKKINSKVEFLGMLPSKCDSRNPRHASHLKMLADQYGNLVIDKKIGLRSSIADALATKKPVWTIKKTAARSAASEMIDLAKFILNRMELHCE